MNPMNMMMNSKDLYAFSSKGMKRTNVKSYTMCNPTKVLLACVYNKNGTLITHDIFYRLFSKYGEVQRILIFEKSRVWKAFIEMDNLQNAEVAKADLNNHILFSDGSKMNVYFSNLDYINFQNNNSGGVDYSVLKSNINSMKCMKSNNNTTMMANIDGFSPGAKSEQPNPVLVRDIMTIPANMSGSNGASLTNKKSLTYSSQNTSHTRGPTRNIYPQEEEDGEVDEGTVDLNFSDYMMIRGGYNANSNGESLRDFYEDSDQYYMMKNNFEDLPIENIGKLSKSKRRGTISSGFDQPLMNGLGDSVYQTPGFNSYPIEGSIMNYAAVGTGNPHLTQNSSFPSNSVNAASSKLGGASTPLKTGNVFSPSSNTIHSAGGQYSMSGQPQIQQQKIVPSPNLPQQGYFQSQQQQQGNFSLGAQQYSQMSPGFGAVSMGVSGGIQQPNSQTIFSPSSSSQVSYHSYSPAGSQKNQTASSFGHQHAMIQANSSKQGYLQSQGYQAIQPPQQLYPSKPQVTAGHQSQVLSLQTTQTQQQVPSQQQRKSLHLLNMKSNPLRGDRPLSHHGTIYDENKLEPAEFEKNDSPGDFGKSIYEEELVPSFSNIVLKDKPVETFKGALPNEKENENVDSQKKRVLERIEDDIQKKMSENLDNSLKKLDEFISRKKISEKETSFPPGSIVNIGSVSNSNSDQENMSVASSEKIHTGNECYSPTSAPQGLRRESIGQEAMSYKQQLQQTQQANGMAEPNALIDVDLSTYVNPMFLLENRKSKVIYVRGLENPKMTIIMIYNLFSNFGNILKIIFLRNKSAALIEFENISYATQAKDSLNNLVFFGHPIKIFYSNYAEINLKKQESQMAEVFIGEEDTFRFKESKTISINPPSCVLHVSNLKKEACDYEVIGNIFSPFGKIVGLKFINMENYKNMCLVKFNTLEESFNALAHLHGTDICGRKIQISFTRSKL